MNPSPAAAPGLRVVRAMPFAAVCVVVSALGHGMGGGGDVPTRALLFGAAVVWALAAALAGRERSLPSIAAALATGQIGLHLLFHTMCTGGAGMSGMAGTSMQGMDMSAMPGMGMGSMQGMDMSGTAGPQGGVLGLTPLMLLGHLLAALAAGWWLRRGEAALWRTLQVSAQLTETLARSLLALIPAWIAGLPGALDPDAWARFHPTPGDERRPPGTAELRHQLVRRGPPPLLPA